ncbi:S8 family serine peptidase [Streptomyces sp. BE147]|uniref:S8 family peptidase n=1 Tax=unclassified Streptomyces TaxID=2593676 RepID=UPI002E774E0B|nr:S8 family serine peptidase [Streptomyces sp. BE147]MEE1740512.1 S8 family serine peptidase [Streptomyces sp. BE147]
MRLRARWAPAALLLIAPLIGSTEATADTGSGGVPVRQSARAVPGQYIVTLEPELSTDTVLRQFGLRAMFTYGDIARGFAATLTPGQLSAVRAFPGVRSVEENGEVAVVPTASDAEAAGLRTSAATWGQDRIDQRLLPLDDTFTTAATGRGVTAYIVDTGIETGHSEFGGRAVSGFDAVADGRDGQDCNGHGTHVAGTVGGATYGVATSVSLVGVRVLDCQGQGTWAGILAGLDWVVEDATASGRPAVLNASLGGEKSQTVDEAIDAVAEAGVLPVVAAGNDSADACDVSPAGAGRVVTVGATDDGDRQTAFSNWGTCLELYAPGQGIVSAGLGGGSVALDGTSMASPHVAGVAALHKEADPAMSPETLAKRLADEATPGVLTSLSPGSPDRLLYTGGL